MDQKILRNINIAFIVILAISWIGIAKAIQNQREHDQICSLEAIQCPNELNVKIEQVAPQSDIKANSAIYGQASFYDYKLDSGWSSVGHKVCAMRDISRKTKVRVTDLDTGNSVDCLVTDTGPDASIFPERIIDLSSSAFAELKPLKYGIVKNIKVESL